MIEDLPGASDSHSDGWRIEVVNDPDAFQFQVSAVDGSYPTLEGAAGDWTVRVQFAATVGTLNFRVEKATP